MTSRARMRTRNTVLSALAAAVFTALTATTIVLASRTPKPRPRLVVFALQPQPSAVAAGQADIDAQLAGITGGNVIVLAMDSNPPAPAYQGSLDCPPELDQTTCQEVKIQKRAQISAAAGVVLRRPTPSSVDVLGLLRVAHDQAQLKAFHSVDLYLDAAGPVVAGSVVAPTGPSPSPTALVDKVSTGPGWVTSCPGWHLNVADAALDPGASAAGEAFVGSLMARCGGQLAAWVGRWPSFNGAIPLPPSTNLSSVDDGSHAIITLDDRGAVTFVSGSTGPNTASSTDRRPARPSHSRQPPRPT